jgi:hypothetical protein
MYEDNLSVGLESKIKEMESHCRDRLRCVRMQEALAAYGMINSAGYQCRCRLIRLSVLQSSPPKQAAVGIILDRMSKRALLLVQCQV